ncbi:hypothetical protein [Prosthecodimorpha staleyi]|uniref:Uncharacterized protein n=1 Tax=Prosthecodimorpha staleyi TaxID=2840188 RepID=A0A947GA36_9HYPH|nr:hypothetical protein [Prosthecodimorpha staleyi]MBT9288663.1 hypothetical protein [Prosthecodimorpha staleyi]
MNRMLSTALLAACAALALMGASVTHSVAASDVAWSIPAAGCSIAEGRELVEIAGPTVRFAPGKTGSIRLVCPISHVRFGNTASDAAQLGGMTIRFQDSSGTDPSAVLAVELVRTAVATGVSTAIGGFKSDQIAVTLPAGVDQNIATSSFQLDFAANFYHVDVILKRGTTDKVVAVTGLALTSPFLRFTRTF